MTSPSSSRHGSAVIEARLTTDSLMSVPLSETELSPQDHQHAQPYMAEDEVEDEESELDMAALLARLELENNALATDPKAGIAAAGISALPSKEVERRVRNSIYSSMTGSHIPEEGLGMSLGDFWALVTKDYHEALERLPTMTPLMIHRGVPDFLRPVVWVGVANARDASLQAEYDSLVQRLAHETPQNEIQIDKDIARCFPQHDMFRDWEGEGQKMLATVLKCFSLYDPETGYCQGMGFIVGILLMNMQAKDAFCVFVRLMETHGLRTSYSQSLSGLHSRIYQFKKLLSKLSPDVLSHFETLGVDFAYLSQWFLTIFAATCPYNVLFRIYDIMFAEGADETIMRVALTLILHNEQSLLAMTELDDVLQLLLSRNIWVPYEEEPDTLIGEVTRLRHEVTGEALAALHAKFLVKSEGDSGERTARALGFTSGFSGFKFLDGWWSASSSTSKSPTSRNNLEKPASPMRRSTSKQSLATLNSVSAGSGADSLMSNDTYASTAPTELERDSTFTFGSSKMSRSDDRSLHEQVEGLLLALSEVQREAAQTAADLQQEREKKKSMGGIVFKLRGILDKTPSKEVPKRMRSRTMPSQLARNRAEQVLRGLDQTAARRKSISPSDSTEQPLPQQNQEAELRQSLIRLCAMFDAEEWEASEGAVPRQPEAGLTEAGEDYIKRLEQELNTLRRHSRSGTRSYSPSERSETRSSVRTRRASDCSVQVATTPSPEPRDNSVSSFSLPELELPSPDSDEHSSDWPLVFRHDSVREDRKTHAPRGFSKRTSSLQISAVLATPNHEPPAEDALLMELVSAKTREATAIHERDEMKIALERMRRQQEVRDARDAEWAAKFEAMQEAHAAELQKLGVMSTVPLTPEARKPSPVRLPSPFNTSQLELPPRSPGGSGGWAFWRGRSVSTGNAGLT